MPEKNAHSFSCDVLVIGGGIAGASTAAELAGSTQVLVAEAESQPGYHTTGRSAAFYAESYGGPTIRPLTTASKAFYLDPPPNFAAGPLVTPRGCIHIFAEHEAAAAEAKAAELSAHIGSIDLIGRAAALERVSVLDRKGLAGAIDDPDCRDLDVAAIHQGYLSQLKARGGRVLCDAPVTALARRNGRWHAETPAGRIEAELVLNAAGAWGDKVARLAGARPVGLTPMRRTVILFRPATQVIEEHWPLTFDLDESFYFKPETGRILASPADETPCEPCDAQPEELDVAIVADRIETRTTLDVPHIETKWAGLRTFAPDRTPVVGPDPDVPSFIWCVGQGGYGIQTAPAMAALTAARTLGRAVPAHLAECGVAAETYDPARFAATEAVIG